MKKWFAGLMMFFLAASSLHAAALNTKVTVIVASNNGSDIDIENDQYRDQVIKLFSYSSYIQKSQSSVQLEEGKPAAVALEGGYELSLTLYRQEGERKIIRALIKKGAQTILNTEMAITGAGPVFMGGPPAESGDLLIVVEPLS